MRTSLRVSSNRSDFSGTRSTQSRRFGLDSSARELADDLYPPSSSSSLTRSVALCRMLDELTSYVRSDRIAARCDRVSTSLKGDQMKTIARMLLAISLALGAGCARGDWIDRTLVTVDVTGVWVGRAYIAHAVTGLIIDLRLE